VTTNRGDGGTNSLGGNKKTGEIEKGTVAFPFLIRGKRERRES